MAESIFNSISKENKAQSAGIIPGRWEGKNLSEAKHMLSCLSEIGIDASKNISKKLTERMVLDSDRIIILGVEKEIWPDYLLISDNVSYWEVEDVARSDMQMHRRIRDEIKLKVLTLIEELE